MPSSYSNQIRLELMADGENSNTWGPKANTVFELIEDAIAGMATVAVTGGAYSLTTNNGAADEARCAALKFTGVLVSNSTITIPSVAKQYIVWNATSGAFTLSLKTSGGSATAVAQGGKAVLWCDGTGVYLVGEGVATAINAATAKATPVDADRFGFWDSVSQLLNHVTWANIKATLSATLTSLTGLGAGAVGAPSIAPSGDSNTGIWFPAADTVAVSTGGSERMRIDTNGNVGIGATPTNQLDVTRGTSNGSLRVASKFSNGSQNISTAGSGIQVQFGADTSQAWGAIGGYTDGSTALIGLWNPSGTLTGKPPVSVDASNNFTLNVATGLLGYGTGAGGTVTQATSKSTAVTLNKPTGTITMHNAALAAGATVIFVVNNSVVATTSKIIAHPSLGTGGGGEAYDVWITRVVGGGFYIAVKNITGTSYSDAIPIEFAVFAGATS